MGTLPEHSCGVSSMKISRRRLILSGIAGSLAIAVPVVYSIKNPRKPKPFTVALDGPFPAKERCVIDVPADFATSRLHPQSVMLMRADDRTATIFVRFECKGPIKKDRRVAVTLCLKDADGRVLATDGPDQFQDARYSAQHPQRLGTYIHHSSPINDAHFRVPTIAVRKTAKIELTFSEV